MGTNLFSAREKFRRAFEAMNGKFHITELVKKGKMSEVSARVLKEHQDFEKAFETQLQSFMIQKIDNNPALINVNPEVKEKFKKDFKDQFNLQALSFSHVNGTVGI